MNFIHIYSHFIKIFIFLLFLCVFKILYSQKKIIQWTLKNFSSNKINIIFHLIFLFLISSFLFSFKSIFLFYPIDTLIIIIIITFHSHNSSIFPLGNAERIIKKIIFFFLKAQKNIFYHFWIFTKWEFLIFYTWKLSQIFICCP